MFDLHPTDLLFVLAVIMIIIHYIFVLLSTKLRIKEKHITYSEELVKYIVVAWVGTIIGRSGGITL